MSGRAAFVTGASGFIGRALVARLVASGWRVVALSRKADPVMQGVEMAVGDLATCSGLPDSMLDGVDVLFHCAGEIKDVAKMSALHVGGTRRLLKCALRRIDSTGMPLRWIQLSSVGAYGPPTMPGCERSITEDSQERPVGEYEVTKTEADRLVANAAAASPLEHVIVRPSNVIGALMPNASLRRLIAMIKRGLFFYIGRPGAMANYVHVDDVVSALLACASHPGAGGQTFNLSSDCTWEALTGEAARLLGVPAPRIRVPAALARAAVPLALNGRLLPLTPSRIDALVNRTRFPSSKIESMLRFRHARPMPAGVEDMIRTNVQ